MKRKRVTPGCFTSPRTLTPKGMTVTAGGCVSLRLNDFNALVEVTITLERGWPGDRL
jgi:hypothetical protein